MGAFDWLRGRRASPPDPTRWDVRRDGDRLVVFDGREERTVGLGPARAVRVIPLVAGPGHGAASLGGGWVVAVQRDDGEVPIGPALTDWRAARTLADRVCSAAGLPLDEASARLFSQVGQGNPREPRDV